MQKRVDQMVITKGQLKKGTDFIVKNTIKKIFYEIGNK